MNPEKKNGALRRNYDEAFKRNAVALVEQGQRGVESIAQELGVRPWTLRKWRSLYGAPTRLPAEQLTQDEKDAEIARLRIELGRSRERELILKKSLGIVIEPAISTPRSKR